MASTPSSVSGLKCVVTGSSGFVGRRLVEMLIERGATSVVALDIREPATKSDPSLNFLTPEQEKKVVYATGDIANAEFVSNALKGCDAVFHIAAAVGPFLTEKIYYNVNVKGTQNVVDACKAHGIRKLVAASTPSLFFTGGDISGAKVADLPICAPGTFLARYAETKAEAESIVRLANDPSKLMTINVAPHQVYGPRDALFLPNFLAASDKLRIIGTGQNLVSFTHVDNYCHGLILAHAALHEKSPVLGKFYLVTDGIPANLWNTLDLAFIRFGFGSLRDRLRMPAAVVYPVAYFLSFLNKFTGVSYRLSPFSVNMLVIDRYFDISDTVRDLNYQPLIQFDRGWDDTIEWFKNHETFWRQAAIASTAKR